MWGNRLGWIISGCILLAAIGLFGWIASQLSITAPTQLSLDPQNRAALSPPQPSVPIVQQLQPGDAGPMYHQAIAAYADDSAACEDFAQHPTDAPPRPIQLLLGAAHFDSMNLFVADPGQVIDYQSDHAQLDNLTSLGHIADRAALMLRLEKKPLDAIKYFQAVYALGSKLYAERLTYDEYLAGLGLMNESTAGLAECAPEGSALRNGLEQQESALAAYDKDHVLPIYQAISSADQQIIATNAGDVFAFAGPTDSERMFRVEAILKLGRYRFDAARKGDQLAAPRVLRQLAGESDLAIKTAANAAQALTLEQYRTIH